MKLKELDEQPVITGEEITLTNHDLKWIKHVSTYLSNGSHFVMPSTFKQWILVYNGCGVKVIKPSGKGNKAETTIKYW